jgi:hypothetical protein
MSRAHLVREERNDWYYGPAPACEHVQPHCNYAGLGEPGMVSDLGF